jgi:hypothetical protein
MRCRRRFPTRQTLIGLGLCHAHAALALPPRYDHVVIVVEENSSYDQILGSNGATLAPYISNVLATEGTKFSGMYALHHPSAQNYSEMFAGYDNGMTDAAPAPNRPLSTPNLGAQLRQNRFEFAGYSESMPSVGFTGTSSGSVSSPYASRHNPWMNWQNDAPGASPNQLPGITNLRFADFPSPSNYASLPTVAFVVPDCNHDMHNGTTTARITTGDTWLKDNIDPYYQWAKTHNSLLIVTWDENDELGGRSNGGNNRIPTLFAGARVMPGGIVSQTYTQHNLLRTVEDSLGLPGLGNAANVRSIAGAFTTDAAVTHLTFRQGVDGYAGTTDTLLRQAAAGSSYATAGALGVDLDDDAASGNQQAQSLIRFDNVVGAGAIPNDATILSAKLTLYTTNASTNAVEVHPMLAAWSDTATWTSTGGGFKADGVKAAVASDFTFAPALATNTVHFDVSDSLQRWVGGKATNNGWVLLPTGADGFGFVSSEGATVAQRPMLDVAYALFPKFSATAGGSWSTATNWSYGQPNGEGAVARFLGRTAAVSVTLDGNKTAGWLLLDSASSYTINPGSGGALTLVNYGNTATIQADQGRHTLAVPINFTDPGAFDVAAGAKIAASAGVNVAAGKLLSKISAGSVQITGGLSLGAEAIAKIEGGELSIDRITGQGAMQIRAGALARLSGTGQASIIRALTIDGTAGAWTGRLDLGKSGLAINYTGPSPSATVADQIKFALATGGAEDGIGSSNADATTAVALAEASSLFGISGTATAQFMGQTVDATSLVMRLTKYGDATMDGQVDFTDLTRLAQNYGASVGPDGWIRGDFNYDGKVDFSDLVKLSQNYGTLLPAEAFVIAPEPGTVAWLGFAAHRLVMHRRCRKSAVGK